MLVGAASIEVVPTFPNWQRQVRQEVAGPHMSQVGEAGGQAVSDGFERGTGRLRGVIGGFVKWGTGALVGLGVAAGTVGIRTAAGMETAEIAFTTMLGSGKEAKSFLGDLSDFAAKTPFDLPGLQTSAQSLISIGIEADSVIPIMTTLGNVTSGMGTGAEGIQRATVALQQMNAAQKISAEDLNQLRDAGIPVYDLLAAATGKSKQEIVEMAQAGKLGKEELDALMGALESGKGLERFNGMMEKQSQSLTGMWSTLKDTFSVGMAEAVQPLIPLLKDGLGGAISFVEAGIPKVQAGLEWLTGKATGGLKAFAAAWRYNDGEVTSSGFPGVMERLGYLSRQVWGELSGGVRAFAAAWHYNDGEVTSSGFAGYLERAGFWARQTFDYLTQTAIPGVRSFFAQLRSGMDSGDVDFSPLTGSFTQAGTLLKDFLTLLPALRPTLDIASAAFGFLAGHVDLVAKALPFLLVGFAGYKTLQAANNVIGRQSVIGFGLQVGSTIALTVANRQLAASQLALNGAQGVGTQRTIAGTIAAHAKAAGAKVATVATKAWSGAQRVLNLVLMNNPLGWVLKGLMLLGGGLVLAYHHSQEFRAVVDNAFRVVQAVAGSVVGWFTGTALPALGSFFAMVGSAAVGLYRDYVAPAFAWIGQVVGNVMMWLINTGWPMARDAFTWIGAKATWLWTTAISPALNGIWGVSKTVFGWVKDTGWPWLRDALQSMGDKATWLWQKVVTPAFSGIKSVISGAWDGAKTIFDKFKGGLDSLRDRFQTVKDGIATIWGAVTGVIANPINGSIGLFNSFLNGLQNAVNLIPGVQFGGTWGSIKTIPVRRAKHKNDDMVGGPGLAGGGIVRGPWLGPRADNVLGVDDRGVPTARVNPREMVLSVAGTKKLLRKIGMAGLNQLNRGELPGFGAGGLVGGRVGGGLGDVWDAITGAGKQAARFLTDPLGALKDVARGLLAKLGDSWPAVIGKGVGMDMLSGLANKVKETMFGGEQPGGPVGKGMGWRSIWATIKGLVPDAVMTSNKRGTRNTASGFPSYHYLGRAVDWVSANMSAAWRTLAGAGIPWTEHYHSGAGAGFMRRGQMVPRSSIAPITIANHYSHGHTAYADGGIVPDMLRAGPQLYDNGGPLPPGDTWVRNATGTTEWVIPPGRGGGSGSTALIERVEISGMTRDNTTQVLDDLEWRLRQINQSSTLTRRR